MWSRCRVANIRHLTASASLAVARRRRSSSERRGAAGPCATYERRGVEPSGAVGALARVRGARARGRQGGGAAGRSQHRRAAHPRSAFLSRRLKRQAMHGEASVLTRDRVMQFCRSRTFRRTSRLPRAPVPARGFATPVAATRTAAPRPSRGPAWPAFCWCSRRRPAQCSRRRASRGRAPFRGMRWVETGGVATCTRRPPQLTMS